MRVPLRKRVLRFIEQNKKGDTSKQGSFSVSPFLI